MPPGGAGKMNDKVRVTVFHYYDLFAEDNNDCPQSWPNLAVLFSDVWSNKSTLTEIDKLTEM